MLNGPCYQCEERKFRCHSACEDYQEYNKQNIERRKAKISKHDANNHMYETIKKMGDSVRGLQ